MRRVQVTARSARRVPRARTTLARLAVNGTLDLQVPYAVNLAAIKAALSAGGNRDHTEMALPSLNHLFQSTKTGSPAEYADLEETFAPSALQIIGDWIVARTGLKAK